MIIDYLHIVSVIRSPIKTNSPLVVDANAVLSEAIAGKFFQAISRRNTKVVNCFSIIQHSQLS